MKLIFSEKFRRIRVKDDLMALGAFQGWCLDEGLRTHVVGFPDIALITRLRQTCQRFFQALNKIDVTTERQ